MNAIKGTWKNGQVLLNAPADWPEGTSLLIEPIAREEMIEFMNENEQSDDPAAIQEWIEDVRSVPPLPMTSEQEAELLAWRQRAKEFNIEAVRKQMEEGIR